MEGRCSIPQRDCRRFSRLSLFPDEGAAKYLPQNSKNQAHDKSWLKRVNNNSTHLDALIR
jgi:hypothetical protein